MPSCPMQAAEFHGGGCDQQQSHWAPAALWNHSTARASAVSAGPGFQPSSCRAFSCVTHIFFLAMRTPFRGTRGGVPVSSAHAVLHTPAHHATAYGSRTVGAWRPVIFA